MTTKTLDEFGCMGHRQTGGEYAGRVEGGDALAFNGDCIALGGIDELGFKSALSYCNFFGTYQLVRHPKSYGEHDYWAGYYNGTYDGVLSRDQLTGFLTAVARYKYKEPWLKEVMKGCIKEWAKRMFLFTNNTVINNRDAYAIGTKKNPGLLWFLKNLYKPHHEDNKRPDLTLFDIWALYARAYCSNWFEKVLAYPILLLGDTITLINVLLMRYKLTEKGDDVRSHVGKLLASREMSTFISKLNIKLTDWDDMLERLTRYWEFRGQGFMIELYKKEINK